MRQSMIDNVLAHKANEHLVKIEEYFKDEKVSADAMLYYGVIDNSVVDKFNIAIEQLAKEHKTSPKNTLIILLHTGGGDIVATENMVHSMRRFYKNVFFIVPKTAMSAGTIFCMSGDRIYMNDLSCLGPIDPQIYSLKEQRFVPANGYLDEVELMQELARTGKLTNADVIMLQSQDLGFLNQCRSASKLSKELLKKWLVEYKFKDWTTHSISGDSVTVEEKEKRAEAIAKALGDNKCWKVHSRSIFRENLEKMRLKINNYTNTDLEPIVEDYFNFMLDFIGRYGAPNNFIHTRLFI